MSITLTPIQQELLTANTRKQQIAHSLAFRSRLILLYASNRNKTQTSKELGTYRKKVPHWVGRWHSYSDLLVDLELDYASGIWDKASYGKFITEILSDQPRSGRPPRFDEHQVSQIQALACESWVIHHWTHALLRDACIERGIVERISVRHLGRLLKKTNFSPT